jgi:hypothetical protein
LVKISQATGCDSHPTLWVDINDVYTLQLLKNVTSNSTTALTEMGWATTILLLPPFDPYTLVLPPASHATAVVQPSLA